ncbi:toprim domain-containing protein [Dysgonomonas sp.]
MESKTINRYSIREYLAGLNIYPAKDKGYYGMYHSPFREDSNASMKVDYDKNLWIDYGSNEGGTLIDLVMRIENCTNGEAMRKLEQHLSGTNSFSFQGNNLLPTERESAIAIQSVKFIENPALIAYLKERNIDIDIAKQCCREVHYSVGGKPYFAIGFKNDSGGYVLRNKYFKGCTSSDITTHTSIDTGNKETCLVFESFTDYLSYLTLKKTDRPKQDAVILNSVHNLSRAMDFIKSHKQVYIYLDNDNPGKQATLSIQQSCPNVSDQSVKYADYKDLNEYLISAKQIQQKEKPKIEVKRKPSRGFRR